MAKEAPLSGWKFEIARVLSERGQTLMKRKDLRLTLEKAFEASEFKIPAPDAQWKWLRSRPEFGEHEVELDDSVAEAPPAGLARATRYSWGYSPSPLEIGLSLQENSFISHASALELHDLTTEVARTIYVNKEQTGTGKSGGQLTQAGIDRAFQGSPRVSRYRLRYTDYQLVLITSKNSGRSGIEEKQTQYGAAIPVTSVARTLIDIANRPHYAGGVYAVQSAYQRAVRDGKVQISALISALNRLDFVYPVHQAVGFYLSRSDMPDSGRLSRLAARGLEFDFYLAHGMKDPAYDAVWRVYYPAALDATRAT